MKVFVKQFTFGIKQNQKVVNQWCEVEDDSPLNTDFGVIISSGEYKGFFIRREQFFKRI